MFELHVTVRSINLKVKIYVAGNTTTCLGLQLRCAIFLSDLNQICSYSTV